jgi:hypothetical protein
MTSVTNPNFSELVVKQHSNGGASGHIAITTWMSDTYIDTEGRTHILYVDNGIGHNVIVQNGTITKDVPLQVEDGYKVSMIQDTTGKFYLLDLNGATLDVYPASTSDTDGTQFGSPVALSLGQYPSCSDGSSYQAPHLAVPRGELPWLIMLMTYIILDMVNNGSTFESIYGLQIPEQLPLLQRLQILHLQFLLLYLQPAQHHPLPSLQSVV